MRVFSRFLLFAVIVVASCNNPPNPSLFQWKSYIDELTRDYYPTRIADSLGWTKRAVGQVDFLITDGHHFGATICWRQDSTGFNLALIGRYTGKELQFKSFGYDSGSGTVSMDEYDRLRAKDSLWWVVADSDFWVADPIQWERALHDNAWLYSRYEAPTEWIAYEQLSPPSNVEPEIPNREDYWLLDITDLARQMSDTLFGNRKSSKYYPHRVCVDYLNWKGHYFCAIVSYQTQDSLQFRGIVGLHDGKGIAFRRVSPGPTTVVGSEIERYFNMKTSDSLWTLEFAEDVVQNALSLEDFFWFRNVNFRLKNKYPVIHIEL